MLLEWDFPPFCMLIADLQRRGPLQKDFPETKGLWLRTVERVLSGINDYAVLCESASRSYGRGWEICSSTLSRAPLTFVAANG